MAQLTPESPPAVVHRCLERLAGWVSRGCRLPPALELDDLVQEGWLGYLAGVERFDPAVSAHFSSYCLRNAIWHMRMLVRRGYTVSLPSGGAGRGGRLPTILDIDAPQPNAPALRETIAAPAPDFDLILDLGVAVVQVLNDRQERVIALRYLEGASWQQITRELGFASAADTRAAERRALNRLARALDPDRAAVAFRERAATLRSRKAAARRARCGDLNRRGLVPLEQFRREIAARHAANARAWARTHPGPAGAVV